MYSPTQATNQPVVIFYSQFMYKIAPHTFRCLHWKREIQTMFVWTKTVVSS